MMLVTPNVKLNRPSYSQGANVRGLSNRDSRLTSQSWQKQLGSDAQNFQSSRVIANLQRQLSNLLKRRIVGMPPQPVPGTIFPFVFYNVIPTSQFAVNSAGTGYLTNDIVTLSGGSLNAGSSATTIQITKEPSLGLTFLKINNQGSYSVQPIYPNSVTGGSGTGMKVTAISGMDSWRTFSMRDGLIGFRSRYFGVGGIQTNPGLFAYNGASNLDTRTGNYQNIYVISGDQTETVEQPNGTVLSVPIMLPSDGSIVSLSDFDSSSAFFSYTQYLLPAIQDSTQYSAAFWIEVVDNSTLPSAGSPFPYVKLVGRMFEFNGNSIGDAFPTTVDNSTHHINVIPVAIVTCNSSFSSNPIDSNIFRIENFLVGNQINLYDAYFNDSISGTGLSVGSKVFSRGDWTADSLSGQYFYPGDRVTDIPRLPNDAGLTQTEYECLQYVHATTRPQTDTTNWRQIVF